MRKLIRIDLTTVEGHNHTFDVREYEYKNINLWGTEPAVCFTLVKAEVKTFNDEGKRPAITYRDLRPGDRQIVSIIPLRNITSYEEVYDIVADEE